MFKKSLAIVSSGLLAAATMVAATPAYAAGELKLEALSGVGYSVPHTSEFELKTSVTAGNDSDELVALKYKITTGGNVNVLGDSGDATLAAGAANLVEDVENSAVYADDAYAAGDTTNVLAIKIQTAADAAYALDAASVSVTVTAFVDKDGDDVVDADEWQASQTITWVDSDLITATTVLTQPSLTDTTVAATVTAAGINLAQSSNIWFVDFTEDDDSDGTADATADNVAGTYDAINNELDFTTAASDAVAAGNKVPDNGGDGAGTNAKVAAGIYGAQAQFTGDVSNGNKSVRTVSAATIDTIAFASLAGADNEALAGNDIDARSGSGSLTVTYTATLAAAAVEDEVLTLVVRESGIASLASAASVSVNGLTLKNTSDATVQKITTTGTTDADGEASFVISWTGALKTNQLELVISADGVTATDTITFEDAAPEAVYSSNVTGTTKSEIYVAKDTAFSLNYSVVDQFGSLWTGTGHSIQVSDTAITRSGVVTGGYAKVDFAGYAAVGAKTMTATLYKGAAIATNQAAGNITRALELTVGAPTAVSAITITETDSFGTAAAPRPLMLKTWKDADVRIGQAAPTVANGITATIALTDANGNSTQGDVTLSGTNLLFADDATAELYKAGSITLKTSAAGTVAVEIFSNTAGAQTLTVTAGGVTKTDIVYFAAAANDTGTVLTIDMPAYAKPGSSFTVTGTLTDKFGNPVQMANDEDTDAATGANDDDGKVDFSITYSGAGLTVGTLPTSTDATGTFKFNVLLGSNDSGTGSVTVSYDAEDDPQDTVAAVVVTKSFTVGTAPAAAADTKVNAGSFKGYVAVYAKGHQGKRLSAKIGNDWVVVESLASNFERVVDFTGAGYTIAVRIYIDRVLVDTITVTTK